VDEHKEKYLAPSAVQGRVWYVEKKWLGEKRILFSHSRLLAAREKKIFFSLFFLQIIADISSVRIFSNAHWVNTLLNYASHFPNLKTEILGLTT
jgi:hypothetical protein